MEGFLILLIPALVCVSIAAAVRRKNAEGTNDRPPAGPYRQPVPPQGTGQHGRPVPPQGTWQHVPPQNVGQNVPPRPVVLSAEGTASQEGECVEENPNHCAVEHPEEKAPAAPAARFTASELKNGILMGEILGRPKGWN